MAKRPNPNLGGTSKEAQLVELSKLQQHEEVDPEHLEDLTREISSDRVLKKAIAVDKNTNVILDGEHRFTAIKNLGCKRIPVIYVDYNSPDIEVKSWRNGYQLNKKIIIEAALTGKRFPPKTSMHLIRNSNKLSHIKAIEKRVDVPLELLKSELEFTSIKDVKKVMHET